MKYPPVAVSPNEAELIVSDWVVGQILSGPAITGVSSMGAFRRVEPPQSGIGAGSTTTTGIALCRAR